MHAVPERHLLQRHCNEQLLRLPGRLVVHFSEWYLFHVRVQMQGRLLSGDACRVLGAEVGEDVSRASHFAGRVRRRETADVQAEHRNRRRGRFLQGRNRRHR